jgi:hypothetical protein
MSVSQGGIEIGGNILNCREVRVREGKLGEDLLNQILRALTIMISELQSPP